MPGEQRVVLGEGALAHQRHLHGHLQVLGQLAQLVGGVGDDHAAAGQDERPFGGEQHLTAPRAPRWGSGAAHLDGQRRVDLGVVQAGACAARRSAGR